MDARRLSASTLQGFIDEGNPFPELKKEIETGFYSSVPIQTEPIQLKKTPVSQSIQTVREVATESQGINPNYKPETVNALPVKKVEEIQKKSSCNKENMAIAGILTAGVAGARSLQESKINAVLAGTKTVTKPKTVFGKLIGGISGRTQAYQVQEDLKSNPNQMNSNSLLQTSRTPITGGLSFGGEATRKTWLPFAVIAGIVALFYFNRNKKKRR